MKWEEPLKWDFQSYPQIVQKRWKSVKTLKERKLKNIMIVEILVL